MKITYQGRQTTHTEIDDVKKALMWIGQRNRKLRNTGYPKFIVEDVPAGLVEQIKVYAKNRNADITVVENVAEPILTAEGWSIWDNIKAEMGGPMSAMLKVTRFIGIEHNNFHVAFANPFFYERVRDDGTKKALEALIKKHTGHDFKLVAHLSSEMAGDMLMSWQETAPVKKESKALLSEPKPEPKQVTLEQLIQTSDNQPTVDGRTLHMKLGVRTSYTTWMERNIGLGFVEGTDFTICFPNLESGFNGGQNKVDHILTLDMAKHIAMIQRSPIGMQIRQYLIDYEKNHQAPQVKPASQLDLFRQMLKVNEEQEARLLALENTKAEMDMKLNSFSNKLEQFTAPPETLRRIIKEKIDFIVDKKCGRDYPKVWNEAYKRYNHWKNIDVSQKARNYAKNHGINPKNFSKLSYIEATGGLSDMNKVVDRLLNELKLTYNDIGLSHDTPVINMQELQAKEHNSLQNAESVFGDHFVEIDDVPMVEIPPEELAGMQDDVSEDIPYDFFAPLLEYEDF